MKSVMKHQFSKVPQAKIARSAFNRSSGWKGTFDSDYLIPFWIDEALPGDTFDMKTTVFGRMNTLLAPIMDNLDVTVHFFAVPNRLLWTNWKRFMGERDPDPDSSIDYTVPQVVSHAVNGFAEGSLWDYMGLPTQIASLSVSALFSRCYAKIYNDWYRDEKLIDSVTLDVGDGPDTESNYTLQKRGKRHDYFTSCLPDVQLGDDVEIGLAGTINVSTDATTAEVVTVLSNATGNQEFIETSGGVGDNVIIDTGGDASPYDPLQIDLDTATAVTITELREAIATQQFLELDNRAGTRYNELVLAHFGVVVPDFRIQRSEYLGGGSSRVNVNQVPQTESSDASTPQGTLTAYGTFALSNVGFQKSFVEHCTLMGIIVVTADLTYQEGLDRMFSRSTRYDYYWPGFANLGEQAVLNKEIYCDSSANDDLTFGYQERYAEYRYARSKITGALRSNASAPLDSWHLSQEFGALPTLNKAFIESTSPVDRVIGTPAEPHFIADAYFDLTCVRPMPVYSVPGLKRL